MEKALLLTSTWRTGPRTPLAHDPQFDRAVDEAMKQLKAKPVDRRTTEPGLPTWASGPVPDADEEGSQTGSKNLRTVVTLSVY
jgi:hypothetical protein